MLDTGARVREDLGPGVVKKLRLPRAGAPGASYAGLDCPVVVNPYTMSTRCSGKCSSLSNQRQQLRPPGIVRGDRLRTLIHYSPVLVDYTDGELFLGQGKQAPSPAPEDAISSG